KHRLVAAQLVVDLDAEQCVVIGRGDRRSRRDSGDTSNLWQPRRIHEDLLPFPEPLYRPEKEQPVFSNGSCYKSSELLAIVFRLRIGRLLFEKVSGTNRLIPKIQEGRSVEVIRSRLGDYVDDTPHRSTAFRSPTVLQDLKLLNAFVSKILKQSPNDIIF